MTVLMVMTLLMMLLTNTMRLTLTRLVILIMLTCVFGRGVPLIGPLLLIAFWQLMISAHWVKPVLLPPHACFLLGDVEPLMALPHPAASAVSGAVLSAMAFGSQLGLCCCRCCRRPHH